MLVGGIKQIKLYVIDADDLTVIGVCSFLFPFYYNHISLYCNNTAFYRTTTGDQPI